MMAEVAFYFPGTFGPDLPWPLCCALHQRVPMFEARTQLRGMLGTGGGISAAFGGDDVSIEEMVRRAYPVKEDTPEWFIGTAADEREGPDA